MNAIMKINTASILILAAATVGGVSSRRVLQQIPRVGVDPTSPPDSNTSEMDTTTSSAEEDLILALEFDAHITGEYGPSTHATADVPPVFYELI